MPATVVETPPPLTTASAVAVPPRTAAHRSTDASAPVGTVGRLPVEAVVALVAGTVCLVGLAVGLPPNLPDSGSIEFVKAHYFSPVACACVLQIIAVIASGRRDRSRPLLTLKLFPLVAISVLVHFMLKAWMPMVNPVCYDPLYQSVDVTLAPILDTAIGVRNAVAAISPVGVDFAYHTLFVGMFFVSLSVHSVVGPAAHQRQAFLGICLILLVGGVAYCVLPAIGPFIYREGMNANGTATQAVLLEQFKFVVATGTFPPGYFPCPLAAMPSLHNAHALFLTLFALRTVRWLGVLYIPVFLWIMIESVASAWHYLADVPVGLLIGLTVYVLVRRLIPDAPVK